MNALKKILSAYKTRPNARQAGLIIFLSLITDQLSKWLILSSSVVYQPQTVLPFLDFTLVWNRGISYGLFSQNSFVAQYGFAILSLLISLYFMYLISTTKSKFYALGLGLVVGGALGNGLDRVLHGAVVDFISPHYQDYYWYVFNLADIWITLGCILVLFDSFFQKEDAEK